MFLQENTRSKKQKALVLAVFYHLTKHDTMAKFQKRNCIDMSNKLSFFFPSYLLFFNILKNANKLIPT